MVKLEILRVRVSLLGLENKRGLYYGSWFRTSFTFLACSNPFYREISFKGLVSAFDLQTWILIIVFLLFWPVFMLYLENNQNISRVLQDTEAMFVGFFMLIEQSHDRVMNKYKKGPLYAFFGCSLLATIVLSNAYKGENINELTASLILQRYLTFEQLMEDKFDMYTKSWMVLQPYMYLNQSEKLSILESDAETSFWSVGISKFKTILKHLKLWPIRFG